MDDIKWFLGILVAIGILWIGGHNKTLRSPSLIATSTPKTQTTVSNKRPNAVSKPTEKTPASSTAGKIIPNTGIPASSKQDMSLLHGKLSIASVSRGTVDKEYVLIQASSRNTESITITGLTIGSGVSLNKQSIGRGWPLYFRSTTEGAEEMRLRPGGRAYLVSGRSPLGSGAYPNQGSFQLNRCTGYFEQGLNFSPSLPLNCPQAAEEPLPPPPNALSEDCYDYLKTLRRCVVPSSVPDRFKTDGSCQAQVFNKLNYNQCVAYHKDETNFFTGEWRVYLGRTSDLWTDSRREIVELRDEDGKLIDARSF